MGVFSGLVRSKRKKEILKAINNLRRTTIGDILTRYIITIRPEDSIIKAATKMIAEDVSCLIVMEGTNLKGILSERDFLMKVPLTKRALNMKVSDIMTPKVVTVGPDMPLPEAVGIMKKHGFRRLVVAKNGQVIGLVTQTDFSKRIEALFKYYPVVEEFTAARILRDAVVVTPKETFVQAREKMKKANIGAIIIADRLRPPQTMQGIFSEYDVVMQFFDQKGELDIRELTAFMRKYVRGIVPSANIFEVNDLLLKKRVHRMPVIESDRVLGLMTQTWLIRFVYTNLDRIETVVKDPSTILEKFSKKKYSGTFKSDHLCLYLDG